jgi:hypothetical protein
MRAGGVAMFDEDVVVGAVDVDDCVGFVFATAGTGTAGATSSVVGAGALSPTSRRVIAASEAVSPTNSLLAVEVELSNLLSSMMGAWRKARVAEALMQMWMR